MGTGILGTLDDRQDAVAKIPERFSKKILPYSKAQAHSRDGSPRGHLAVAIESSSERTGGPRPHLFGCDSVLPVALCQSHEGSCLQVDE